MGDLSAAPKKKGLSVKSILLIQAAVIIYTFSSICSKIASSHPGSIALFGHTFSWLSPEGYLWLFLELCCLGCYAIFWQQIIKRVDLSIAYANRAFAIFWTFLWSVLFFNEAVSPRKFIGIFLVFFGIQLVNQDAE